MTGQESIGRRLWRLFDWHPISEVDPAGGFWSRPRRSVQVVEKVGLATAGLYIITGVVFYGSPWYAVIGVIAFLLGWAL